MKKNEVNTFVKLFNRFIEEARLIQRSEHTITGYEVSMKLFLDYLEKKCNIGVTSMQMGCFSLEYLKGFREWLVNRKNKPETVNLRMSQLTSFLEYASKIVPSCMVYLIGIQSIEKIEDADYKDIQKAIHRDAIQVLLSVPGTRSRTGLRYPAMFSLQYFTVTRIDEIRSLKIKDIDLTGPKPKAYVVGKGRKGRTVPIPRKLIRTLSKYIKDAHGDNPDKEAYLFYSPTKGLFYKISERTANKQLRVYAVKANKLDKRVPIDFHSHQFRHSGATHLWEDGLDIFSISRLLGHESVETTKTYLGISDDMLDRARHKAESLAARQTKPIYTSKTSLRDLISRPKLGKA